MKLCEKILSLRKQAGLSQEELAEKLGVSRQAVSRWEVGSAQPDASNVLQLSKLFAVTADYLLNEDYDSDFDVPAVKSVTRGARQKMRCLVGAGIGAAGLLGNLIIYIISRCVKVNAPVRYYDENTHRFMYLYDNVPRINYEYFVEEYHLQMLLVLLWILTLIGLCFVLWNIPAVRQWVKKCGQKLRKNSQGDTAQPKADPSGDEADI